MSHAGIAAGYWRSWLLGVILAGKPLIIDLFRLFLLEHVDEIPREVSSDGIQLLVEHLLRPLES